MQGKYPWRETGQERAFHRRKISFGMVEKEKRGDLLVAGGGCQMNPPGMNSYTRRAKMFARNKEVSYRSL